MMVPNRYELLLNVFEIKRPKFDLYKKLTAAVPTFSARCVCWSPFSGKKYVDLLNSR